ncbi:MAG: hypothetical protein K8W52_01730 [Deltaproteobacteria bacterium]|nr:hypothetical protein [Deltaproteobacteria bacterium]
MNPTIATSASPVAPAFDLAGPRTLDDLAALDSPALERVYRAGRASTIAALDGDPRCRMLAVRGAPGPVGAALRAFAASSRFPWAGKSFASESASRGSGINRVRLAGDRRWFPFVTTIEPSAIDGQPCVFLDYRLAANPKPIQMIRDELREVAPGLFLGPAMFADGKRPPVLALWFACHHVSQN